MWILLRKYNHACFFIRRFNLGSVIYKTHYEVLKLPKDCSQKEIRNAFISLSKELHPDKNKGMDSNEEFAKLSEAYNILSKPHRRHEYDLSLSNRYYKTTRKNQPVYHEPYVVYKDNTFWKNRDKSQDKYYSNKSYYGIKGINKLSNKWIVFFCFVFTSVGVGLQVMAIRKSFTFKRDSLDRISQENSEIHANIRSEALKNGNMVQIELMEEKLKSRQKS